MTTYGCRLSVIILLGAFFASSNITVAQSLSNIREFSLFISKDTTQLDTMSIIPDSFEISDLQGTIDPMKYELLWFEGKLIWKDSIYPKELLNFKYRIFNFSFPLKVQNKDPDLIIPNPESDYKPYIYRPEKQINSDYFSGNLARSGSITRGISLGNNQDLSVTSGLDLQLNGSLNKNIKVRASVTDNNIPIQPDGNTQQLQDFDQVFIELYTDKSRLVAGDFNLEKPTGYFMNYLKKAQGIRFQTGSNLLSNPNQNGYIVNASAAISKGKFARNTFNAIEGNQGPYRLTGNESEPFIIVLSGSEKVYLDGRLLSRGADHDYIINYNTSEVIFTSKQPMTKDKRIVVDFQYSDKNYVRSLATAGFEQKSNKIDWFVQAYSEQDSKNQPLQQDLKDEDKLSLHEAGDDFLSAYVAGEDSVGFSNDFVLYSMIDSLGFDSVFVYSNHPDSAFFRVIFSQVGLGNGDYVEDSFVAGGKTYRWIQPEIVGGELVHNGNYAPLRLLKAPVKQQLVAGGINWKLTENLNFSFESAVSNLDKNTFSPISDKDNVGFGLKAFLSGKKKVFAPEKSWYLLGSIGGEKTDNRFVPIENFRSIEFQRDWNLGGRNIAASDYYQSSLQLADSTGKSIGLELAQFLLPEVENFNRYKGQKSSLNIQLNSKKSKVVSTSSLLQSQEDENTLFFRNKSKISRTFGKINLGVKDEIEDNRFFRNDSLFTQSHQFYFGEVFLENSDSSANGFRLFYNQRLDRSSDSILFLDAAFARQYGGTLNWKQNPNNRIKLTLSNRELEILNPNLIDARPESTLLGRLDHSLKNKKSSIALTSYYEINSGLEPKKEFIFLEVPAGQGSYVWNDYNGDNVKDLNEFEVAQFDYEANYIRSFIPSDAYQKVFGNFYSQTLQLTPKKSWNSEEGFLKFLTHFATLTSYRTERKTTFENAARRFNPFLDNVVDTSLVALNKSFRNTLYFNRTHPVFGADYTFSENKNKSLLTNGFESRFLNKHEVKFRWTLPNNLTFKAINSIENKKNGSNFLTGRNYHILTYKTAPEIIWQPNNKGSLTLVGKFSEKTNLQGENSIAIVNEKAEIVNLGLEGKINSLGKGVFQINFNWIDISYNGAGNDNLAYEMLEGLQQGVNYTWGLSFQRKIAKNIQFNLNYQGRKTEFNSVIHAGGMSARAFF